ncbi:hypothetical protein CHLREDRAFT_150802 [Acetobacter orientalis]|uniref:Uncharacterized protein n=1 Tax=Acetobacter orientalis TaxID=146474 RepID=A0A2Z5ZJZ7_9PROT|nr:hypothetical protein CHLREDRAFT_150802 [Acetobacter orientalis]
MRAGLLPLHRQAPAFCKIKVMAVHNEFMHELMLFSYKVYP